MGDVGINGGGAACLFIGFFQFPPVFFLIIGYAEDDLFFFIFPDQRGSQADRYALSVHQHPVIMDQGTVFMDHRQHVFFRQDPQMSLQIFRGNGPWRIRHNIGEEILSQFGQTDIFIGF